LVQSIFVLAKVGHASILMDKLQYELVQAGPSCFIPKIIKPTQTTRAHLIHPSISRYFLLSLTCKLKIIQHAAATTIRARTRVQARTSDRAT
jgi:hypothetical protein